jgi:hypothetical protein
LEPIRWGFLLLRHAPVQNARTRTMPQCHQELSATHITTLITFILTLISADTILTDIFIVNVNHCMFRPPQTIFRWYTDKKVYYFIFISVVATLLKYVSTISIDLHCII